MIPPLQLLRWQCYFSVNATCEWYKLRIRRVDVTNSSKSHLKRVKQCGGVFVCAKGSLTAYCVRFNICSCIPTHTHTHCTAQLLSLLSFADPFPPNSTLLLPFKNISKQATRKFMNFTCAQDNNYSDGPEHCVWGSFGGVLEHETMLIIIIIGASMMRRFDLKAN